MFGAVIMPHNVYFHSSLVLTRKINAKSRSAVDESIIYNNIESAISLFMTFLISMAIISTFAVYADKHKDA